MITLGHAKRKSFISILAFGGPGTGKSTLALGFPNSVVVDAHNTLDSFGDTTDARILRTAQPSLVSELIAKLKRGEEKAGTFVLDGVSRILDEIQVMAEGSNGRYYAAVRKRLYEITDAARALPMHIVFTARSKDSWAKAGDIVNGYVVGPEDKIVSGTEPDVDRSLAYEVDLVLEMLVDNAGGHYARVVSSHIPAFQFGQIIEEPTAAKILALANLGTPPAAVVDLGAIDETHQQYGSNEHLKQLNAMLNAKEQRSEATAVLVKDRLVGWNLWDGKANLSREARGKIVKAYQDALESATPAEGAPQTPASELEQLIANGVTNNELMALFSKRNTLCNPAFDRITTYIREHVGRAHVKTVDDVTLEDRLATRSLLEAEIAAASTQAATGPAPTEAPATAEPSAADAQRTASDDARAIAATHTSVVNRKPAHRD